MKEHRYTLASNKVQKLTCPYCGAKKHWQRYIDIETGEILPKLHGKCDNESKCGQWVTPKETGYAKMIWDQEQGKQVELSNNQLPKQKEVKMRIIPETTCFDFETFRHTLQPERYENNVFIQNLLSRVPFPFDADDVTKVIQLYRLGTITNGYRAGANTFPFIDINGNIRTIQVKQFDEKNHTTGTDFLHSIIEKHCTRNHSPLPEWLDAYKKQEKLVSCLFGEHLLGKYPTNPVGLVEAPKSAVYASLYFGSPQRSTDLVWLAVYNLSSLTLEKCQVLKGRKVILFPDLSVDGKAYRLWEQRASELNKSIPGSEFIISDLLETNASDADRERGLDLADYLIRMDWRAFRPRITVPERKVVLPATTAVKEVAEQIEVIEPPSQIQPEVQLPEYHYHSFRNERKKDWVVWPVEELVAFFDEVVLPESAIQLDTATQIVDVRKFINAHIDVVKANNGNPSFIPYLDRLNKLKSILS